MTLEELNAAYEVSDFFDYIIDSYLNGNFPQVIDLYNKLETSDKITFLTSLTYEDWCNDETDLRILRFLIRKGVLTS